MIDSDGYITEGSSSNAWILIRDKLITTPATNSILKGITRTSLIRALKRKNIKLIESDLFFLILYENCIVNF